jgi:hypothetical protein
MAVDGAPGTVVTGFERSLSCHLAVRQLHDYCNTSSACTDLKPRPVIVTGPDIATTQHHDGRGRLTSRHPEPN